MKFFTFTKKASVKSKQRGQGMSEYIIITALIAVAAIGVFTAFGGTVRNQVAAMTNELSGASGATQVTAAKTAAIAGAANAAKGANLGTYGGQTP